MRYKFIFGSLLCVLCLCFCLFQIIYSEAENRAIAELNARQMIHAKQAQSEIETYFNDTVEFLTKLSASDDVIDMGEQGQKRLDFAYSIKPMGIQAITRVDGSGKIIYTTPTGNDSARGRYIGDQDHVRRILDLQKPVASDVFMAVQGYRAIAVHVPVFRDTVFLGSLAVLIDFKSISERFFKGLRLGKTGYAWMVSQKGIELFCPVSGHIGKSVFENCKDFPTILSMAKEMVAGNEGTTTYNFNQIRDQKLENVKKHAVYLPVSFTDNFWSIVVATSEDEVLTALIYFRNKLFAVIGLLIFSGGVLFYYGIRVKRIILEGEQQRKMKEALRESEEKYRLLIENQSDLVVKVDLEGTLLFVSSSYCEMFGETEQELLGKKFMPMVHEEDREATAQAMEKLFHPPYSAYMEQRAMTKDGWRWLGWQDTGVLDDAGNIVAIIGVGRDLEEQKKHEKELQAARTLLEAAMNQSPSGILIADAPNVRIRYANPAAIKMRGGPEELLTEIQVEEHSEKWQTFHPDGSPYESRDLPLSRAVLKGEFSKDVIIRIRNESGEELWASASAGPIMNLDGTILAGIVVFNDISDRIRAEAALRESEERFRTLVEKSPFGISLIGRNGMYKYINPQFTEIFGYTMEDVPSGRAWFEQSFPEKNYRQKVIKAWIEDQENSESGQTRPRTVSVVCKDDSRKDIYFLPVTMENSDQFVIYEDITEKMRLEKQLVQAQKFEAIGTLAGGIAHDFNNLMMTIQGRASLISLELGDTHPLQEHLKAIEEGVISATHLTRQLLGFARGGKYLVTPLNINELLLTSAEMFGRTRKEIKIHSKVYPSPLIVDADKHQIEQVLLNIFINSWQAMPYGGEIYLETTSVEMDEKRGKLHNITPGKYCRISVTDTGIGMDEVTRQRIFDPFFTTKEKSRGTGLGLASAYGIINNHGGAISVESELGDGATFHIYLHLSEKSVGEEKVANEIIVQGTETILLVDDEEMVTEVGKVMLEKLGYNVIVANSGQTAIEEIKKAAETIDLVILDMIMPGMDGNLTFDRIRQIQPEISVMLSSGYSINGQAEKIMDKGCNGFIQKPFSLSALSKKLREILG